MNGPRMFQASTPIYERTPEKGTAPDGKAFNWFAVRFEPRAIVADLAEAKERFGRNVVLEWIGRTH